MAVAHRAVLLAATLTLVAAWVPSGSAAALVGPTAAFASPGTHATHALLTYTQAGLAGDAPIVSAAWDFGDGATAAANLTSHRFDLPGTYNVTLTVTDANNLQGTVTQQVTATAAPLQAFIGPSGVVAFVNATLSFTDYSEGGNGTLVHAWSFGDGTSATDADVDHAWNATGRYVVRLNVTDADGATANATVNVTVLDGQAAAGLVTPGLTYTVALPQGVDVRFGTSGAGGAVDMRLETSTQPDLLGNLPAITGGVFGPQGVLYLRGTPGVSHDRVGVDRVVLVYHYGLLVPAGRSPLAYYWDGAAWQQLPTSAPATPLTILSPEDPEGNQVVYDVVQDPAAQTLSFTLRHASLFGFAAVASGGGGGGAGVAPAAPAPSPAAPTPAASPPIGSPVAAGPTPATAATAAAAQTRPSGSLQLHEVQDGGGLLATGATVGGPVDVHWAAAHGEGADVGLWLVAPSGAATRLFDLGTDRLWDPAGLANGDYWLEARAETAATSPDTLLDRIDLQVYVAQATPTQLLAGAALVIGIVAAGSVVQVVGTSLATVLQEASRESVTALAEERYAEATTDRGAQWLARLRRLRPTSLLALLLACLLVAASFSLQDGWSGVPRFLGALTDAGLPTAAVFLCAYGFDWAIARAAGARPRLQFALSGALALAASTLMLRIPFGNPGRVEEGADGPEATPPGSADHGEAAGAEDPAAPASFPWAAAASLAGPLGLLAPLWVLDRLGFTGVADVGVVAVMSVLVTTTIPVKPLTGSDLWHWRKTAALAVALAAFALYGAHSLALVSFDALGLVGVGGLAGFFASMVWLVEGRREEVPRWFRALDLSTWRLVRGLGRLEPSPVHRALGVVSRTWDRAQRHVATDLRCGIRLLLQSRHPVS